MEKIVILRSARFGDKAGKGVLCIVRSNFLFMDRFETIFCEMILNIVY